MRRLTLLFLTALLAATAVPPSAEAAKRGQCLLRKSGPQCYLWTGKVTFIADGDTVYVDVDGDGSRRRVPIRITGLQAMEQTTYTSRASARRGECHAVEATARLDQLLKAGKYKVRLYAQDPASRSGKRLRRSVAVRVNRRWNDVARVLITEGHGLWLPNHREFAWNRDYSILQLRAQRAQLNLWDADYCGFGPAEGAQIRLLVNWDADGDDNLDPNGEWVRITNPDPVNPLPLGGWWLRDSALRRIVLPDYATVPPGGHITIYDGIGDDNESEFYWGLQQPAFENVTRDERGMGDGAYVFDPQGDLRASQIYPCREGCADPASGSLAIGAKYRGRESVQITNNGALPIDLEPYRLVSKPYSYAFAPNSVVQPGETMRVRLYEGDDEDQPLTRYWATNGPILNNGGDVVQLRRFDDVLLTCTAWGSRSC
ncbi:MAG TPA: lamin tail domain-containing protein [Solirubrobacteraceae bacterium]|nr:lamin tail domain-containing protein [Solirubrobacteraceae bacterium]